MSDPARDAVREVVEEGVRIGAYPGACYAFGNLDHIVREAVGNQMYCWEASPVTTDTRWDMASVTKVVATTTVAMLLWEDGKLDLDKPVASWLPGFGTKGKEAITPRHLLMHESGLIPDRPFHLKAMTREEVLAALDDEPLQHPVGTQMVYSDLNMLTMMKLIEHITGEPFERTVKAWVLDVAGMDSSGFCPPGDALSSCAPTEFVEPWRVAIHSQRFKSSPPQIVGLPAPRHPDWNEYVQGEVHDPTAATMGGVAGHAGLFSTIDDMSAFAYMMLTAYSAAGRVPKKETISMWTKRQKKDSTRGLGWDTKNLDGYTSAGRYFSDQSFGHTGFTGTSIWIDPVQKSFAILLTNRVHPTAENQLLSDVRPKFAEAAALALGLG